MSVHFKERKYEQIRPDTNMRYDGMNEQVKQVAARNRILVLFDVFKTKVFGRDVSQF